MNAKPIVISGVLLSAIAIFLYFENKAQLTEVAGQSTQKITTSPSGPEPSKEVVNQDTSAPNNSAINGKMGSAISNTQGQEMERPEVSGLNQEKSKEPELDDKEAAAMSSKMFASMIVKGVQLQGIELNGSQQEKLESEISKMQEFAATQEDEEQDNQEAVGDHLQEILKKTLTPDQFEKLSASMNDAGQ